jgi:3D (Asp-Asp-Asp) domain-containing protein
MFHKGYHPAESLIPGGSRISGSLAEEGCGMKRCVMNSLLSELGNKSIIPGDAVVRFKAYIARKNPDASVSERAAILAGALNRVLDQKLPDFGKVRNKKLKKRILEQAVQKAEFEIFCSDAFQAAVELMEAGEDFLDKLGAWLEATLDRPLQRERLVGVVLEAHRMMALRPEMDAADMIAEAEAVFARKAANRAAVAKVKAAASRVAEADRAAANAARATAGAEIIAARAAIDAGATTAGTTANVEAAATRAEAIAAKAAKAAADRMTAVPVERASETGSAGYAASRLKAVSRDRSEDRVSARQEIPTVTAVAPAIRKPSLLRQIKQFIDKTISGRRSADYAAARLKAIARGNAAGTDMLETDFSLSGYRRRTVRFPRIPVAAAAAVLLVAGLAFGIGSISTGLADNAAYLSDNGDRNVVPSDLTILAEEEAPAGGASGYTLRMKATAYDLSVGSCGKKPGEPGYGITFSGTKAEIGRTVAVDPEVIPLGSRLLITFPEEYSHLNGIYIAEDTGRLIKGNAIDIFFGGDDAGSAEVNKKAMAFGVRYVDVEILDDSTASKS